MWKGGRCCVLYSHSDSMPMQGYSTYRICSVARSVGLGAFLYNFPFFVFVLIYLALSCNVLPGHNSLVAVSIASQHIFDHFCFMKLLKTTVKHIPRQLYTTSKQPHFNKPRPGPPFQPEYIVREFLFRRSKGSTTAAKTDYAVAWLRTTRIQFEQERCMCWNWSRAVYVSKQYTFLFHFSSESKRFPSRPFMSCTRRNWTMIIFIHAALSTLWPMALRALTMRETDVSFWPKEF